MYKDEIEQLKNVIKKTLVVDPVSLKSFHYLDKGFENILDRLYENTYENAYAQGFEEGYKDAENDRRKAEKNDPFGNH